MWHHCAAKLCEKAESIHRKVYTCTLTAPTLRHKLIMWKNTTFKRKNKGVHRHTWGSLEGPGEDIFFFFWRSIFLSLI